jgi:hypothetical protein
MNARERKTALAKAIFTPQALAIDASGIRPSEHEGGQTPLFLTGQLINALFMQSATGKYASPPKCIIGWTLEVKVLCR